MPWRPRTHRPVATRRTDARPSAARRGYGHRWRKYRAAFLKRNPVCQWPGCNQWATDVDHKVAVTGPDDPLFWEPTNHQALCHGHHSRKTAREDGGFGRGT